MLTPNAGQRILSIAVVACILFAANFASAEKKSSRSRLGSALRRSSSSNRSQQSNGGGGYQSQRTNSSFSSSKSSKSQGATQQQRSRNVSQSNGLGTKKKMQSSGGRSNFNQFRNLPSQSASKDKGLPKQTGTSRKLRFPSSRNTTPKSSSQQRSVVTLPSKSKQLSQLPTSRGRTASGKNLLAQPTRSGSIQVINSGKQLPKSSSSKSRTGTTTGSYPNYVPAVSHWRPD